MSRGVLFCGLLCTVLSHCVEACNQKWVQAVVPEELPPGYAVCRVNLNGCGSRQLSLDSSDPHFTVQPDGTILTARVTTVTVDGITFWVWVRDDRGQRWKVDVSLSSSHGVSPQRSRVAHKRTKRRWSPLPFSVIENDIPPFPKDVESISSDSSVNYSVYYDIRGPGVTTDPIGLFSVEKWTGMLHVHRPIDREVFPQFVFEARVFDRRTDRETDLPLPITVNVEDVNDNAPELTGVQVFSVPEDCKSGTIVGAVNATDKDEPNTPHTKIKFTLLNGTDLFHINSFLGVISAKTNTLDRETQDRHVVNIELRDMGGSPSGLFSKGTVTIVVTDINDNPPTFKEKEYKARVPENQADVLVLRIPVDDKDQPKTPNWNAVFDITKGNENGHFKIETDPKTNEGLLYVIKPLDHEKGEVVKLEIKAKNQAPLEGTASWLSVPIELTVGDEDEGPEFSAPILRLIVKENIATGTIIGTYTATDPETKSSKGITYHKMSDPASWITVIENTGGLQTADIIDRESDFVSNSMYNITVKAVDESQKTATGMVLILIEDVNDNQPQILTPLPPVCVRDGKMGSTLVEAEDPDQSPYSQPFTFELGGDHDGKWKLKDATGSSVVLEPAVDLPTGQYSVPLIVKDLQGFGQTQTVTVRVCVCMVDDSIAGVCMAQRQSTALGAWGVLAILLALALLLLLCLLFVFVCNTQKEKLYIDDGTGGMLLKSNTEAPGEEVKQAMLLLPSVGLDGTGGVGGIGGMGGMGGTSAEVQQTTVDSVGHSAGGQVIRRSSMHQTTTKDFFSSSANQFYVPSQYGTGTYGESYLKYSDLATLDTWRTNEIYLDKKLIYFGEEEDGRYATDQLRDYAYEGEGSPAGSVGCCSNHGDPDTLDFLDSLGPKFRMLADICINNKEGADGEE